MYKILIAATFLGKLVGAEICSIKPTDQFGAFEMLRSGIVNDYRVISINPFLTDKNDCIKGYKLSTRSDSIRAPDQTVVVYPYPSAEGCINKYNEKCLDIGINVQNSSNEHF